MRALLSRVAVAALLAAPLAAQDDTRPTLAVLPFVNSAIGAANAELAPLSKGIADLLITDLGQNPGIRVVERENIQRLLDEQRLGQDGRVDDATAARIGKLLGAKHMVTGAFITDRTGKMVITLKSIDSETGRIIWTHRGEGKTEEFLDLIAKVSTAANAGLLLPALTPQARQASAAHAEGQQGALPGGDALLAGVERAGCRPPRRGDHPLQPGDRSVPGLRRREGRARAPAGRLLSPTRSLCCRR